MMNTKKVYLTIDDGPSTDFADKIRYLYDRDIPAVFFCLGENILRHEGDIIEAIHKGFIIGNHAFQHRYFSDMSLAACQSSIQMTDAIIDAAYAKSGMARRMKLFRFPYFDRGGDESGAAYQRKWSRPQREWFLYPHEEKRAAIQSYLQGLGYAQPAFDGINLEFFADKALLAGNDVRCTFDQMEYFLGKEDAPHGLGTEASILGRIDEDVPYVGRSLNCLETADIILVHDEERTTALFYTIIDRYLEKRFQFMAL